MSEQIQTSENILAELTELRQSIDHIDAVLIFMLSERFNYTKKVGRLKAKYDLAPVDLDREKNQMLRLKRLSAEANLDPVFAEKFLRFIIEEVVKQHKLIAELDSDK